MVVNAPAIMSNTQNNQDNLKLIQAIIDLNKSLVREQYRQLALESLPRKKVRPPYHFYLN